MFHKIILPAGFLAALIVGAGMFSLPYVFFAAGPVVVLHYLILFAGVFIVLHLLYADVIVRTVERHRFVGYAKIYLGKKGFVVSIFTTLLGYILISTIYLILSASFFKLFFNIPDLLGVAIFWLISLGFIFLRIKILTRGEFIIALMMLAIVAIVFIYGLASAEMKVSYSNINPAFILLPFGPILFSLSGRAGISSIVEYFGANRFSFKLLWRPIVLGTIIPILIYWIFTMGILNITQIPSKDAVSGLINMVPSGLLWIIALLGLASLGSSYTIIAREIEGIFASDFRLSKNVSLFLAASLPFILYLLGLKDFLSLVAFVGGVFIAIESILVILIWKKARKIKSEHAIIHRISPILIYTLIIIFVGGVAYEITTFLGT